MNSEEVLFRRNVGEGLAPPVRCEMSRRGSIRSPLLLERAFYLARSEGKPKLTREQMIAWFNQFRHGDPANREFQKRLIDTFVNAVHVFDDTHPSKSSFGKLLRNDLIRGQWYSCPATASRNGDSSERSSEGCKTREQRQPPFSRCLCSGKKRRTGASIKISKAGAALRKQSRPVAQGIGKYGRQPCFPML
mgnify:CR=1 FL=1